MSHVVLLGDSIFDNGAYVRRGEPDVVKQVQAKLPHGWRATLCAVDGAVTTGVERQMDRVPPDASHLVVSAGGNDALRHSGILREQARSVADVVGRLALVQDEFARSYRAMLDRVLERRLPTAICTIYDARFPDPQEQRLVVTALSIFNDVITREAFARRLPLIDLRLICNEPDDYANPIEPSAKGGDKIAGVIAQAAAGNTIFPRSQVYAQ
ncbi:SGNH/GDSL hydrolase family protein [Microvirga arsenatis]|uniref:SGNH/GDSL hydrolase family protein n=1 Tax=Microvirga arsenatis TaxID=2692265 RepID=A0ABW9YSB1_9HYPH|nr:SGNH/GDSL hydrolase family protein [Microvirga arsenatis]NBJ10134.1 SGNH/GDSL hydrolase family protein [Microvirga arsenatis]NBJ23202.1 SGNH/GDSL hydrolase family protein [Microvirga arsenatis]